MYWAYFEESVQLNCCWVNFSLKRGALYNHTMCQAYIKAGA